MKSERILFQPRISRKLASTVQPPIPVGLLVTFTSACSMSGPTRNRKGPLLTAYVVGFGGIPLVRSKNAAIERSTVARASGASVRAVSALRSRSSSSRYRSLVTVIRIGK